VRAFLTGGSGFVGGWLRAHLESSGDEVAELADGVDIRDPDGVRSALRDVEPDVVYHLAALTHVGRSWEAPEETIQVNVVGTLHVLEAARRATRPPRVLLVSSAEVYGAAGGDPLGESAELRPVTPYAASKVAAEFLGLEAFLGRGLEVVRCRPFNHVGPGQSDAFVVSGLARRIAESELSGAEVRVGNLSAARDFTDVRDVVRAYRMLARDGVAGEVYNVSSGVAVTVAEIFDRLAALARAPVRRVEDPELFRPVDVPLVVGNAARLHAATGWEPTIGLETTLGDVLEHWREQVARRPTPHVTVSPGPLS
jgi:GDP-4-dehydro-6-deoxy-D-mannose reductase